MREYKVGDIIKGIPGRTFGFTYKINSINTTVVPHRYYVKKGECFFEKATLDEYYVLQEDPNDILKNLL